MRNARKAVLVDGLFSNFLGVFLITKEQMFCTLKIVCGILYTKVSVRKSLVFKRVRMGRTEKFIYTGGNETVWLSQVQMTMLFSVDRTVITRHVNNVFKEKELEEKSNVQFLHIPNSDKPIKFYSLDVIISVGYRVKSQRGVEFRKWANSVL